MVFENLVVYLLDKYLGDYIENLDTKKLKVDLWTGMFNHHPFSFCSYLIIILRKGCFGKSVSKTQCTRMFSFILNKQDHFCN
jgi:hypothetical protein